MSHDPQQEPLPPGVPPVTHAPRAPRLLRPPFWIISFLLIAVIASWLPLVLFARGRTTKSSEPRVHLMQDMGSQPKYREQQTSDVFADGRADRPRVPGTVARGQAELDDHYYRGYTWTRNAQGKNAPKFFEGYPSQIQVNKKLVERGRERFNIFCAPCHGLDGYGAGTVAQRSAELGQQWNISNLHDPQFRDRPEGDVFNTITVGIRTMPPHSDKISVDDRWAIVAYVRALQLSQNAQ